MLQRVVATLSSHPQQVLPSIPPLICFRLSASLSSSPSATGAHSPLHFQAHWWAPPGAPLMLQLRRIPPSWLPPPGTLVGSPWGSSDAAAEAQPTPSTGVAPGARLAFMDLSTGSSELVRAVGRGWGGWKGRKRSLGGASLGHTVFPRASSDLGGTCSDGCRLAGVQWAIHTPPSSHPYTPLPAANPV